jgi:hypothetical protein
VFRIGAQPSSLGHYGDSQRENRTLQAVIAPESSLRRFLLNMRDRRSIGVKPSQLLKCFVQKRSQLPRHRNDRLLTPNVRAYQLEGGEAVGAGRSAARAREYSFTFEMGADDLPWVVSALLMNPMIAGDQGSPPKGPEWVA